MSSFHNISISFKWINWAFSIDIDQRVHEFQIAGDACLVDFFAFILFEYGEIVMLVFVDYGRFGAE